MPRLYLDTLITRLSEKHPECPLVADAVSRLADVASVDPRIVWHEYEDMPKYNAWDGAELGFEGGWYDAVSTIHATLKIRR